MTFDSLVFFALCSEQLLLKDELVSWRKSSDKSDAALSKLEGEVEARTKVAASKVLERASRCSIEDGIKVGGGNCEVDTGIKELVKLASKNNLRKPFGGVGGTWL